MAERAMKKAATASRGLVKRKEATVPVGYRDMKVGRGKNGQLKAVRGAWCVVRGNRNRACAVVNANVSGGSGRESRDAAAHGGMHLQFGAQEPPKRLGPTPFPGPWGRVSRRWLSRKAVSSALPTPRVFSSCQSPCCFVRNITIKNAISEAVLISVLTKISECSILHKLCWKNPAHIPRSALDKLHTNWPNLELSSCVTSREVSESHVSRLDINLLSSPLLRDLIYPIHMNGPSLIHIERSEWPKMARAILNGGNIRRLSIHCIPGNLAPWEPGQDAISDDGPEESAILDDTSAKRLPAMVDFAVIYQLYCFHTNHGWNEDHCTSLLNFVNLSRIRRLDFGVECPNTFFSTATGKLPSLRDLRFGITTDSVQHVLNFIESLIDVESLDIAYANSGIATLWRGIKLHAAKLEKLFLRPSRDNQRWMPRPRNRKSMKHFTEDFLVLERLGWMVQCELNINPDTIIELSKIELKKLDLFTRLPTGYSLRHSPEMPGESIPPPLFKDSSIAAGIEIMETVSRNQGRPLEWLTIHFSRIVASRNHPAQIAQAKMQIRRTKYVDADTGKNFEVRGRMEWLMTPSVEEELWLEED